MNRKQRNMLFVISVIIVIIQIVIFTNEGIKGHGWVLSFGLVSALLYFAFGNRADAEKTSISGNEISGKYISEDKLLSLILRIKTDIDNSVGNIDENTPIGKSIKLNLKISIQDKSLLYVYSMVQLSRFKDEKNWFSSREYIMINRKVGALASALIFKQMDFVGHKIEMAQAMEIAMDAIDKYRNGVNHFIKTIGVDNNPAKIINAIFYSETGIETINDIYLADYYRDQLQIVYKNIQMLKNSY